MPRTSTDSQVAITEVTRLIRLSYLQTLAVTDDQSNLSRIAGETQGDQRSSFTSDPGSPAFLGMMGGEGGSSASSSFADSGWQISRTWLETWWDKIRFAIGIREIGIFSYRYDQTSELISVPFRSPVEIDRISLVVDEAIPASYPSAERWIEYYVSVDNGTSWQRINPLDQPTLFGSDLGRPVPRIIHFNPDFAAEDDDNNRFVVTKSVPLEARFRAIFKRPLSVESDRTTPILKSYRMQIFPKGGLLVG